MDQLNKPFNLLAAFLQSVILTVAWVDTIDIAARILVTIVSLVVSAYLVKRIKRESKLAETRNKREQIELEMKEAELAEFLLKKRK